METAESIISDALFELIVQEAEQDIEPFEFERGKRIMNRMFAEWAGKSINLGYTVVTKPDDAITIPASCMSGVVSQLAIRMASALDVPVPIELATTAKEGMNAIRLAGFKMPKQNFPSTLSIGSGNEGDYITDQSFFAGCCEDDNEC